MVGRRDGPPPTMEIFCVYVDHLFVAFFIIVILFLLTFRNTIACCYLSCTVVMLKNWCSHPLLIR